MRRWLLVIGWVALAGWPAEAKLDDATLLTLLGRPGATVAARVDADFDGDGTTEVAVLFDTSLPGRWRLALVREGPAGPRLLAGTLKSPVAQQNLVLSARDLTGDGHPELVVTGSQPPHGVAYQVFELRDGQLRTLLTLTDSAPTERIEGDLGDEGHTAIVHVTGNHTVWAYSLHLTDYHLEPYVWDGTKFGALGWRPATGPAAEATARLTRLAAAHLWSRALIAADEARAVEPGPATTWNRWLVRTSSELFTAQREAHRGATDAEGRVCEAVAAVLAGDWPAAAKAMLTFRSPAELPRGWETPWQHLKPIVDVAWGAAPNLMDQPAALVVRGLAQLAAGSESAARLSFQRAQAGWLPASALAPWVMVGLPGTRLYFLGLGDELQQVDLAPDGRLLAPVARHPKLGRLRAVAGVPGTAAVTVVPEAGNKVLWLERDHPTRTVFTGDLLYLSPHAVSPDGRTLAVDSGTSVIRRLLLVDLETGRHRGTVTYAGGYAWSPEGGLLALEVAAPAEPPLPWEDGLTRDIALFDTDGRPRSRPARGDATHVYAVESWDTADRLVLLQTRFQRTAGGMDARPTAAERQVCDPESGRRAPLAGPPRATADRAALARRLKLPDDDFEPAEGLFHPRFFVYRRRTAAGSDLYVLGRGTTAQPRRIAAVPSLTQPLVASWGATSGR